MAVDETVAQQTAAQAELHSAAEPEPANAEPELINAAAETASAGSNAAEQALQEQLRQTQAKLEDHWSTILRQQAEQENLRKRMEREIDKARKFAIELFANELLPVKDSLEMGLEAASKPDVEVAALREGNELILKLFNTALEKAGVVEVNPRQGERFNPEQHEAIAMAMAPAPDAEPGSVLLVHQKGYQLNDRLLRPARVIVAKALDA